jgi:hypothetical protein
MLILTLKLQTCYVVKALPSLAATYTKISTIFWMNYAQNSCEYGFGFV